MTTKDRKSREYGLMLVGIITGLGLALLAMRGDWLCAGVGASLLGIAYFLHRDITCNDDILLPDTEE